MKHQVTFAALAAAAAAIIACSNAKSPTAPTTTAIPPTSTDTQSMYSQFGNLVSIAFEGGNAVLRTTDIPDHRSPYFGPGDSRYEAPKAGMMVNPNRISAQNITLRIPLSPTSATASDTPLGPIGIAVNGVVFYNQYAAMRQPLTSEIISFDQYNGHPNQQNQYHYHFEPVSITASSKSRLIGVLLDGFPVYGPNEGGGASPSGLDSCHGHVGATTEFPSGIYHYHASNDVPYISGCFRGAPGVVQQ